MNGAEESKSHHGIGRPPMKSQAGLIIITVVIIPQPGPAASSIFLGREQHKSGHKTG